MSGCRSCGWRVARLHGVCLSCRRADFAFRVEAVRTTAPPDIRRADPIPQPNRSVVVNGIEYDVVFDGRQSLLGSWSR